jgi:hypothetical protein
MKLRQKVIFLAIAPLILALCAIALFVRHQSITLAQQQRATIQQAYLATKEAELKHYVALASHSVAHLYDSGRNDAATLAEAKRILSTLSYGSDGYFFVYDLQGKNLMHPRQPELVGHNLWNLRDPTGSPTLQRLIERANAGGGLERYVWLKPSTSRPAPKLGYVVPMARWNWMLGTGIYLDDVDAALARIDAQQSRIIDSTMAWIAALAILSAWWWAAPGWRSTSANRGWPTPSSRRWRSGWSNRRSRSARGCRATCTTASASRWCRSSCRSKRASFACPATPRSSWPRATVSSAPPASSTTCWAKCGASRTTCVRRSSTTWGWPPRWHTWPANSARAAARRYNFRRKAPAPC